MSFSSYAVKREKLLQLVHQQKARAGYHHLIVVWVTFQVDLCPSLQQGKDASDFPYQPPEQDLFAWFQVFCWGRCGGNHPILLHILTPVSFSSPCYPASPSSRVASSASFWHWACRRAPSESRRSNRLFAACRFMPCSILMARSQAW